MDVIETKEMFDDLKKDKDGDKDGDGDGDEYEDKDKDKDEYEDGEKEQDEEIPSPLLSFLPPHDVGKMSEKVRNEYYSVLSGLLKLPIWVRVQGNMEEIYISQYTTVHGLIRMIVDKGWVKNPVTDIKLFNMANKKLMEDDDIIFKTPKFTPGESEFLVVIQREKTMIYPEAPEDTRQWYQKFFKLVPTPVAESPYNVATDTLTRKRRKAFQKILKGGRRTRRRGRKTRRRHRRR